MANPLPITEGLCADQRQHRVNKSRSVFFLRRLLIYEPANKFHSHPFATPPPQKKKGRRKEMKLKPTVSTSRSSPRSVQSISTGSLARLQRNTRFVLNYKLAEDHQHNGLGDSPDKAHLTVFLCVPFATADCVLEKIFRRKTHSKYSLSLLR